MKISIQLQGDRTREHDSDEVKVAVTDAGVLVVTHKDPRHRVSYAPGFWLSLDEELPEARRSRVVVS